MRLVLWKELLLRDSADGRERCRKLLADASTELRRARLVAGVHAAPTVPAGPVEPMPHVAAAQAEYLELLGSRGNGKNDLQLRYLEALAAAADSGSIPFWRALLGHTVARDQFKPQRDEYALTALALLVIEHRDAAALAELVAATRFANPTVRGMAAELLVLAHPVGKNAFELSVPPEVVAVVEEVARGPDFVARFGARRALSWARREAPIEAPEGVFRFEARPASKPAVRRIIELRSSDTLVDLADAILDSVGWVRDAGFAFALADHPDYLVPAEDDPEGSFLALAIGRLGLVARQRFVFGFDPAAGHRFEVELLGIDETRRPGASYPRTVERAGAAPRRRP